jgi:hypothetical protein
LFLETTIMPRTRTELERIIERGESVILADGRVVTRKEDLPSEVDLAGDDIVRRQAAAADLRASAQLLLAQAAEAERAPAPSAPKPPTHKKEPEEPEVKTTETIGGAQESDPLEIPGAPEQTGKKSK